MVIGVCSPLPFAATKRRLQSGFSYLWVLLLVAVMGLGLSVASDMYVTTAKREREKELLAIGRQFQAAIRRYHDFRAGEAQAQYPASLEDLLRDPRAPGTVRHLRKIFVDPMTGKAEWGLIKLGDRVVGVHSMSRDAVLKKDGFDPDQQGLAQRDNYAQWLFVDSSAKESTVAASPTAATTQTDAEPAQVAR